MKIPTFLDNKSNVIVYRNNSIINQSSFEINKSLKVEDENTVYLYIENYADSINIDFLENSKTQVYLIFRSSEDDSYNLNINVLENAHVNFFTALRNKGRVNVSIDRLTNVARNGYIKYTNALLNMGESNLSDLINLNEEHAEVEIDQLNIASQNDKTNVSQEINHNQKYTKSNIYNSLISNKNSKLKYDVLGRIAKGNEYSVCNQLNKGIILAEKGSIEVLPMLFIDEYNVEASHGAAIGQMDDEQLYYLLSRGLTELEAKTLIIYGYTNPFITSIEDEDIQEFVERQITKKINEGDIL